MSESNIGDEQSNILIKRPFATKTLKELDRQQVDFNRRLKRKQRKSSVGRVEQFASRYQIASNSENEIPNKLQEVIRHGNRIIAEWKNDQIHGFAEIYYRNGIYFKGIYQNGIKVKGHFKFKSGFQYLGSCFGNSFAGEGVLRFPNGKTIEGEWKNFQIIGNGKISYPKGEVYYGEIKEFNQDGKGYFYYTDGSKYEGEFSEGLITGKGCYYIQGKLVSAGKWLNGQLQKQQALDNQPLQFQSTIDKTVDKKDQHCQYSKQTKQNKDYILPSQQNKRKELQQKKVMKSVYFN